MMLPLLRCALVLTLANAFVPLSPATGRRSATLLFAEQELLPVEDWETSDFNEPIPTTMEKFLTKKFPEFFFLLKNSPEVLNVIRSDAKGVTFFAPSSKAFENLGFDKLRQLEDERNLETAQKMGAYHVIQNEAVRAERLRTEDWTKGRPKGGKPAFTVEGIETMGGVVPIGRSKSGGFFGFGATEDGDAVVGPNARIVQSYLIGGNSCIVHEMDGLISPKLLWRYCDQLRIPGF
jgi:uncharacterized surface protein with fasciclin (FAS1) repeats